MIRELEAKGIPAYPPIAGNVVLQLGGTDTFPLAGISEVTTVYCNESGEYTIYESDEHGFQNPRGIWKEPAIDIVVLGDSFAHGACVPSDKNFVSVIRSRYPRTLNLAMGGTGPLHELATLIEYGLPLRPSVILWAYYEGNDLDDLAHEKDGLLRRYLSGTFFQGLIAKQPSIDVNLKEKVARVRREIEAVPRTISVTERFERFMKLDRLRMRTRRMFRPNRGPVAEETFALFGEIIREATMRAHAQGSRLIFVYLPQYARYTRPELASPYREGVLALFQQVGDGVIDLYPVFTARQDPVSLFPFRRPGHYTVEGNQLVGDHSIPPSHSSGTWRHGIRGQTFRGS